MAFNQQTLQQFLQSLPGTTKATVTGFNKRIAIWHSFIVIKSRTTVQPAVV